MKIARNVVAGADWNEPRNKPYLRKHYNPKFDGEYERTSLEIGSDKKLLGK